MHTDLEVKEFLESAREATLELARYKHRLRELEEDCLRVTARMEKARAATRTGAGDGAAAALCDAREELLSAIAGRQKQMRKVEAFIDRVPGPDLCRIVLRLRYLEFRRWTDAQRCLEQIGVYYSERQLLRRHAEAMEQAEALWQREKETKSCP